MPRLKGVKYSGPHKWVRIAEEPKCNIVMDKEFIEKHSKPVKNRRPHSRSW
jgi:hypothetical protein